MHLVQLGADDYRPYQRLIRSLKHSVNPNGATIVSKNLVESIQDDNKRALLPKQIFISSIQSDDVEAYFLRNDKEENIGIVYMLFQKDGLCHIVDFGILDEYKGKGIGREFFNMLLSEVVQPKGSRVITLHCPFLGSQIFWKKMGFEIYINKDYYRGNPLMRKRL